MALEHPQMMTVEEYFHLEETDTENRYEYIDGQVYMMAGGTFDHSTISGNIYSLLRGLLRGKPCRVYNSDIKRKPPWKKKATTKQTDTVMYCCTALLATEHVRSNV